MTAPLRSFLPALAAMAASALMLAPAARAESGYPTEQYLDFFGTNELIAPTLSQALQSLAARGLIATAAHRSASGDGAHGLAARLGIVDEPGEFDALAPALCALNPHLCRASPKAGACPQGACLKLKRARRSAAGAAREVDCRTLAQKAGRAPRDTICMPVAAIDILHVKAVEAVYSGAEQPELLARQLVYCADAPCRGDEARNSGIASAEDSGYDSIRRVRLRIPAPTAEIDRQIDDWRRSFEREVQWAAGDVRPPELRMRAGRAPRISWNLTGTGAQPSVPLCASGEADCLNRTARSQLGIRQTLEQRQALSQMLDGEYIVAFEAGSPFLDAYDKPAGAGTHCAFVADTLVSGMAEVKKSNNQLKSNSDNSPAEQARRAIVLGGAPARNASSPSPSPSPPRLDCAMNMGRPSDALGDVNHALTVVGIISAEHASGNGSGPAAGILPRAKVGVVEISSFPSNDYAKRISRLKNAFGEKLPLSTNASLSGREDELMDLSVENFLNPWIDRGIKAEPYPLLVAPAGKGPVDDKFAPASLPEQFSAAKNSPDYAKGRIDEQTCLILPACFSVIPAKTAEGASSDVSDYVISVVALDSAMKGPLQLNGVTGFHGPAFDVAAPGAAEGPAVVMQDANLSFGYRRDQGSSVSAPYVTSLAAILAKKAENYGNADACRKVGNHFEDAWDRLDPSVLARSRILASADYWPENLKCENCNVPPPIPGQTPKNDRPRFSPEIAQFGRVNFARALAYKERNGSVSYDYDKDSVVERGHASSVDVYRGPWTDSGSPYHPMIETDAIAASFANRPASFEFGPAAIKFTGGRFTRPAAGSDQGDLVIPVSDILRIEKLPKALFRDHSGHSDQHVQDWNMFRVVFLDRYDKEHPFKLKHLIGASISVEIAEPQKKHTVTVGGVLHRYQIYEGLPIRAGAAIRTIRPGALDDFLSAWPTACGHPQ
jgi:hypothetical protein